MGMRFIGQSPERRGRAAPLPDEVLALFGDRIRNADLRLHRGRTALARFHSDSGTSRLHVVDALDIPCCPITTRLPSIPNAFPTCLAMLYLTYPAAFCSADEWAATFHHRTSTTKMRH